MPTFPHETEHAGQDKGDHDDHDHRRPKVKAHQDEGHGKDGRHAEDNVDEGVVDNCEVLLVEHVEHTGTGKGDDTMVTVGSRDNAMMLPGTLSAAIPEVEYTLKI